MRKNAFFLGKLVGPNGLLAEKDASRHASEKIGKTCPGREPCARRFKGKRDGLAGARQGPDHSPPRRFWGSVINGCRRLGVGRK